MFVVADYPGGQPDELMGTATVTGDYAITADTCSGAHVRTSCRITLPFRPAAAGTRDGKLTLPAQNGTAEVALSALGFGTGRLLDVQPPHLSFGSLGVGVLSAPRPVTITNAGDLPLSVAGLLLSGERFSFGTQDCFGSSLAPGASCSVAIRFGASDQGNFSGLLRVACAPTCDTATVLLDGSTQGPPVATPTPTPNPQELRPFWTLSLNRVARRRKGVLVSVTNYPKLFVIIEVLNGNRLLAMRRTLVLGDRRVEIPVDGLRRGRTYRVRVSSYNGQKLKQYTKSFRA
jgi:hypothetical protein